MITGWSIVVWYFLPIPLVLIFLLSIPLPLAVKKRVVRISSMSVWIGPIHFTILSFIMTLLMPVWFTEVNQLYQINNKLVDPNAPLDVQQAHIMKRWRTERNFYITSFCMVAWFLLHKLCGYFQHVEALKEELRLSRGELQKPSGWDIDHSGRMKAGGVSNVNDNIGSEALGVENVVKNQNAEPLKDNDVYRDTIPVQRKKVR
eukprot:GILK01014074.1.p1 GENE.GILK01014074.1~~GILK01014074.1.p1  ORF type:complete len:203 (-),score=24.58 GILK01014074.1:126-734(-)